MALRMREDEEMEQREDPIDRECELGESAAKKSCCTSVRGIGLRRAELVSRLGKAGLRRPCIDGAGDRVRRERRQGNGAKKRTIRPRE